MVKSYLQLHVRPVQQRNDFLALAILFPSSPLPFYLHHKLLTATVILVVCYKFFSPYEAATSVYHHHCSELPGEETIRWLGSTRGHWLCISTVQISPCMGDKWPSSTSKAFLAIVASTPHPESLGGFLVAAATTSLGHSMVEEATAASWAGG